MLGGGKGVYGCPPALLLAAPPPGCGMWGVGWAAAMEGGGGAICDDMVDGDWDIGAEVGGATDCYTNECVFVHTIIVLSNLIM